MVVETDPLDWIISNAFLGGPEGVRRIREMSDAKCIKIPEEREYGNFSEREDESRTDYRSTKL